MMTGEGWPGFNESYAEWRDETPNGVQYYRDIRFVTTVARVTLRNRVGDILKHGAIKGASRATVFLDVGATLFDFGFCAHR